MIDIIEQHRPEVAALCSRFGVQSLEVFGSAANGAFDPTHGHIDFLVEFLQDDAGSLFDRYFGLQEALELLFARKIDLVTTSALENPDVIAVVNRSRQTLYASAQNSGDEVRAKLADLRLKDADIDHAVTWARKSQ
ncbi:MAG: nucleotidyltransferase domain-containing protein [Polaromonas sp.]|nr:nucleotidyltransferase domain-containing protein [Polaromonas sp.]